MEDGAVGELGTIGQDVDQARELAPISGYGRGTIKPHNGFGREARRKREKASERGAS